MEQRTQRLAMNEALFRELNEGVQARAEALDSSLLEAYCECADLECVARITLTAEEYSAVRENGTQFLVRPGHDTSDLEEVIARTDRFEVVRKRGDSGAVANLLEPT